MSAYIILMAAQRAAEEREEQEAKDRLKRDVKMKEYERKMNKLGFKKVKIPQISYVHNVVNVKMKRKMMISIISGIFFILLCGLSLIILNKGFILFSVIGLFISWFGFIFYDDYSSIINNLDKNYDPGIGKIVINTRENIMYIDEWQKNDK